MWLRLRHPEGQKEMAYTGPFSGLCLQGSKSPDSQYRTWNLCSFTICLCGHVAGRPGQWLYHSSEQFCESSQISDDFRCRSWYIQERQNRFSFWDPFFDPFWFWSPWSPLWFWSPRWRWNPFRWLPACPCWYWQAEWDWQYWIDPVTRCATSFGFGAETQVFNCLLNILT